MRTVLVVDDEELFLRALEQGFATTLPGVRVLTAPDGRRALGRIESEPIDVVVTDLSMPEMDGFELVVRIRRDFPAVRVIVVTAFGTSPIEDELRRLGIAEFLEKPLDFHSLASAVEAALAGAGAEDDQAPADINTEMQKVMSNVQTLLEEAMRIDGAVGVALVDWQSGMCLGTHGGGPINLEVAAAGNTEVVRSKLKVMSNLGLNDKIEDILITLGEQYHLIRIDSKDPNLFFYLVLNRSQGNLAMARHQLASIEKRLEL